MQRQAAIWILRAFKTSPLYGIEVIAGLVPIHLHLLKLGGRSQLCTNKLPPSHLIQSLIKLCLNTNSCFDAVSLNLLTNKQYTLVKGHLIDSANRFNECLPSFDSLNLEISPGLQVIDNFQIKFLLYLIKKRMINYMLKTLTKWFWNLPPHLQSPS